MVQPPHTLALHTRARPRTPTCALHFHSFCIYSSNADMTDYIVGMVRIQHLVELAETSEKSILAVEIRCSSAVRSGSSW